MNRFFIYGVVTSCLTLVYALRLAFHSTILCQYDPKDNSTDPHYLTNPNYKVLSYASVSIGLIIGLIPLSAFYHLGTRKIFCFYGIVGIGSTLLYPAADAIGFLPAFIIRLLQGVPGAMYLWAVNSVSLEWAPLRETGQAVAILTSFYQLSPIVASVISGELCTGVGWEYTYYFLGAVTSLFFIVFWLIYTENPRDCLYLRQEEADMINEGKFESKDVKKDAPLWAIFTDPQVYLAWGMYFTFFLGSYIFLQFGPVYISLVLKYEVLSTGYAMALPHFITLVSKFAYGRILDKFCDLSQRFRLIIAYSTVEIVASVCLCTILFTNSTSVALLVYIVFNSLHNLVVVVIMRHMQLIARQHSHVLANGNTFIVAVCVLTTSVLQYFVLNNSQEQWTAIFLGVAGSILVTVLLYAFCSTSKPRKWTEIEAIPLQEK